MTSMQPTTTTTMPDSTSVSSQITASPSHSSVKSNKRKLEDAIQSLDDAVGTLQNVAERPTPAKRPHTVRTLYSTLAKYGIKSKEPASTVPERKAADLSKTPHLAAILARTATKTRKAIPHKFRSSTPLSSSTSEYRPSSTPSFLSRLATFKLNTYSNKPPAIDAVAASKCGWINDGKDRLVCGICAVSWVLAGREGMSKDAANALVEKQRLQLVEMHKDGCPWKTRQCDPDVYRIPLSSPAAMARETKSRALMLESVLEDVQVKHPLTSTQVQALLATVASIQDDQTISETESLSPSLERTSSISFHPTAEPSSAAVLTALFGWSLAPVAPSPYSDTRLHTPSMSRATSVAPSMPSTPRAPSRLRSTADTAPSTPSTPRLSLSRITSRLPPSPSSSISEPRRDAALLHCTLCHRRLGLWAVSRGKGSTDSTAPSHTRQIDLLREHRPYCPYVVRSTTVPSLPVPPSHVRAMSSTPSLPSLFSNSNGSLSQLNAHQSNAMEGWRAVLMVVLRYRMGQRKREELLREVSERAEMDTNTEGDRPSPLARRHTIAEGQEMDEDPVEAMVAGVKTKGGKDLLNYVKGLLG
ncbi:zf-C3HC-domain-containing protein [Artomyces pyxidatus]|uniref:Zf-C3HC-domain-containing protein n=1 Tax=Artomyces pyxidatus TaxID=48021 RepID=A0ACB8SQ89_9AGAM|nr:zf-C3HC-domain-containing protein [Artomyces pyxidatus]